ncbi:hypothetical protein [Helicobacter sp. 13S00477-4]|uniref:hypothetical protein n=1 Tax=Helicobacter sp. 13S00477-4 TaxID=1905759 RepID=UPI001179E8CC|nr:hypothetical protein [Helicobacter sp. 13S00477-4]
MQKNCIYFRHHYTPLIKVSKMILFFFFIGFSISIINAKEESNKPIFPYEKEYLQSWNHAQNIKIRKTPLYIKGLETIYLSSHFKKEKLKDPVDKDKEIEVRLPDYKQALDYFIQSFNEEKNLAAAFIATKLMEMAGQKRDVAYQIKYFNLIEPLARQNNCKGLERKATYLFYGMGGVIEDKKAAKNIAKKALKICSNTLYENSLKEILQSPKERE